MTDHRNLLVGIALTTIAATHIAYAQTATVLTTGLNSPMKVILTPEGNLLISESTVVLNTGRVSIVDRSGTRRTLLDGLPSGPALGSPIPLGPSALVLDGRTLYISILEGNALAPASGGTVLAVPNPAGVASPILSSILKVQLSADVDRILSPFQLTLEDHFTLADFWDVVLTNADGQTATLELLADFPDTPLDRREVHGHLRLYGMTLDPDRKFLYVADAGQNRLVKVDADTGRWQTVVRFPRIPRVTPTATDTETDAVPTGARFY